MIYKTKVFQAVFKKSLMTDHDLVRACYEITNGLVDANLGSSLFKKRVAIPGQGKRGSYRTMLGAVVDEKYFFLYLFAKSQKSNLTKKEEVALKELAKTFVNFNKNTIDALIANGELLKVEVSK